MSRSRPGSLDPLEARAVSLRERRVIAHCAGDADMLRLAEQAAHAPIGAVLLSGGTHECSRHSFAMWDPFLTMSARGNRIRLRTPAGESVVRGDPLQLLDTVLAAMRPDFPRGLPPFAGGAAGYLSYDLKNRIERLPRRARADPHLPDLFLFWPRRMLIHDRAAGTIEELTFGYVGDAAGERTGGLAEACPDSLPAHEPPRCGPLRSNFTRPAYLRAVERVRSYILRGDIYQVNLSQRFTAPFTGDPWVLWRSLFERNPAPFYAYVQAGDHQVLSTSMERFLCLRDGALESRPIKGTRPRGKTPAEDDAMKAELAGSLKDDAELSMIVDLVRNDLGRVCRTGTVEVQRHKMLESYANVHHLVSIVAGRPRADVTPGAILRAAFPCGSITGCPKIRAMEIIDELEHCGRHVYTGSIGYIGWHGTLDLNVAIRTAVVHRGACSLSVGGGIVYDSEPEDEFDETLHKGQTFFEVMGRGGGTK